jgi:hypothetical protein
LLIASTQVLQQSGCSPSVQANIPLLDAYFTGTGVHICLSVSLLASFAKLVQKQHHCASGHTKHCFVASCTAGDLMTALLLANLYKDSSNMQHAVEQAIGSLQAVLQASAEVSGPAAHSRDRSAEVDFFLVDVLCFAFFIFCSHGSETMCGEKSLSVVHQTHAYAAQQQHVITALHGLQVCKARELRLIQNQHLILSPPVKLKVTPLDTDAN